MKDNKRNLIILIGVLSGIFGFIYEEIFYRIDLGMFVKRGSSFGPWIPIYVCGGLLIYFFLYRLKKNPVLVFFLSSLITGILEYGTGYVLDKVFHTRLWDYNTEIWNYGNINGYICLRSILFFGLSSLFLIYAMIPFLEKFIEKNKGKTLNRICIILGSMMILDIILYQILKNML